MITADQILAHLVGDYLLQSDWMAQNKTKAHLPAAIHAVTYSLLFLPFRPSLTAWLVIVGTHFLIDRYRLARYVVWAKNWLAPTGTMQSNLPWHRCQKTGYGPDAPDWLAVWLLIIGDNILHLAINGLALKYL